MNILQIKTLDGPNYWSDRRTKLIVMKLDLGPYESRPTQKLPGFTDRLVTLIPSLYTHRCSKDVEGGFIQRMREGTWLGHVIEHVALELQCLAGMDCGFGRTRSTRIEGIYQVVFTYQTASAGRYAAEAAVQLVQGLADGQPVDIYPMIQTLSQLYDQEKWGPSTQAIVDEAMSRHIPVTRLDDDSLVLLGQGKNQKFISATIASTTSNIAVELAGNKEHTKALLKAAYIPVPEGQVIRTEAELIQAMDILRVPIVVKPVNGNHGRGITTNITTKEQAINALILSKTISDEVIIERYIPGKDYRFLVVNYKLTAVSERTPAKIVGDGQAAIRQLIERVNQNPNRGEGHEKILTKIRIDEDTQSILREHALTLSTILPKGRVLFLKSTANISTGGTARDVTHKVHPHTVFLVERVARLMHLDICGIDVISSNIGEPLGLGSGAVLEVNAAPGFRMHQSPSAGQSRNVAAPVIDMLYPKGSLARIPIVAVTGTNGKTTTTRMIAHLAKQQGHSVGFTTTDGIYIGDTLITTGDCSGPDSARAVLRDPFVDYAVLECARGGILRGGLGFDHCNVSVVTNITEDHLGLGDIHDLDDLTRVKSVVPRSTFEDGYAVLNADDDRVYAIRKEVCCQIALFSRDAANPRIREHCFAGGIAAVLEEDYFSIWKGTLKIRIEKINRVPITFNGTLDSMVENTLTTILAGYVSGISIKAITGGIKSFYPGPDMTPGRMNVFYFDRFRVLLDYAHNVDGYRKLQNFFNEDTAVRKIGIIGATGDRREQDIIELGETAAGIFTEIIIRHDADGRGRTPEELTCFLKKGIERSGRNIPVAVISKEQEAIAHAMAQATDDTLIFVSCDDIHHSIAHMSKLTAAYQQRITHYGT